MGDEKNLIREDPQRNIEKKLQLSSDLFDFALKLKMEQLKRQFPEKTEIEIRQAAVALIEKANQWVKTYSHFLRVLFAN